VENEKKTFSNYFTFGMTNFAVALLTITFVSWIVGNSKYVDEIREMGGIMELAGIGISYAAIGQLILFSALLTCVEFILNKKLKRVLLMWHYVLRLTFIIVATVIFIIVFKWFPLDSGEAWISFIGAFFICLVGGTLFMVIKTKMDDRKYGKQLLEYKAMKNEERGNLNDQDE